jgi:hypothetical protein
LKDAILILKIRCVTRAGYISFAAPLQSVLRNISHAAESKLITEAQSPGGERMMKKPVALAFIAAAILFLTSVTTYVYGQQSVLRQRLAAEDSHLFTMTECDFDMQLDSWEQAAGLIGLVAASAFIAAGLLWGRETQSEAERLSILGINERRPRQIARETAPCKCMVVEKIKVKVSDARPREDDYLTPLERVIRGY